MSNTRVALVDDYPTMLRLWEIMFERAQHFEVCASFTSAGGILDYVRANPRDVDLILLDLHLPGRSGLDILPELREVVGERVMIVLVSGMDYRDVEDDIRDRGVEHLYDLYVSKDTSVVTLVKEISLYVHHKPLTVEGEVDGDDLLDAVDS